MLHEMVLFMKLTPEQAEAFFREIEQKFGLEAGSYWVTIEETREGLLSELLSAGYGSGGVL